MFTSSNNFRRGTNLTFFPGEIRERRKGPRIKIPVPTKFRIKGWIFSIGSKFKIRLLISLPDFLHHHTHPRPEHWGVPSFDWISCHYIIYILFLVWQRLLIPSQISPHLAYYVHATSNGKITSTEFKNMTSTKLFLKNFQNLGKESRHRCDVVKIRSWVFKILSHRERSVELNTIE